MKIKVEITETLQKIIEVEAASYDEALDIIIRKYKNSEIILDRKLAIKTIIEESNIDDIILILGRGNEEYQHIGNQKLYLNDYVETHKCLEM